MNPETGFSQKSDTNNFWNMKPEQDKFSGVLSIFIWISIQNFV